MNSELDDATARVAVVRSALLHGARDHYDSDGVLELRVPTIVGAAGACENVATLVQLKGERGQLLTQTGQLALERALQWSTAVWCTTPSYRADPVDSRHLNEFDLVEEEVSCDHAALGMERSRYVPEQMFEMLLDRIAGAVGAMIGRVLEACGPVLTRVGRDRSALERAVEVPFARVSYARAIEILGNAELHWGDDLGSEHEAELMEVVAAQSGKPLGPVFVTHFPEHTKFFNMRVDDNDPQIVQSVDLLLPFAGETVGGAVREHDYEKLATRLEGSSMLAQLCAEGLGSRDDFDSYLNILKAGRVAPHAGYGLGLERLMQFIFAEPDIRRVSLPYLLGGLPI